VASVVLELIITNGVVIYQRRPYLASICDGRRQESEALYDTLIVVIFSIETQTGAEPLTHECLNSENRRDNRLK
jgi:hypothetical protein